MNTFVVHPDEGGPFPVVLFYMDAPGKREELHDMARRIASVGYFVVLPNLYYRRSRDYWLRERTEEGFRRDVRRSWARSTASRSSATPQAMLAFVDADPIADRADRRGRLLHGRALRLWAAAAFPERLRCIASIHGANMVDRRCRLAAPLVDKVRCEAYFACAETDKWAPPAAIAALKAALELPRANYRLEWYPGAEHGFVFPLRAGIYHKAAAERHWERLFSLFRRTLAEKPPRGSSVAV